MSTNEYRGMFGWPREWAIKALSRLDRAGLVRLTSELTGGFVPDWTPSELVEGLADDLQ